MNINLVALAAALLFASSGAFAHDMGAMADARHGAAPIYAFGEPGKAAKVDRNDRHHDARSQFRSVERRGEAG